jgi:hypothetical protein
MFRRYQSQPVADGSPGPSARRRSVGENARHASARRSSNRDTKPIEMLAQVWRTPFASSNKVEAVVRSLRLRCALAASLILE